MSIEEPTTEAELARRIDGAADEEHAIRSRSHGSMTDADRTRLAELQVERDRLYDLKRQREARRDAGEDPAAAHERSTGVVEGYRQ